MNDSMDAFTMHTRRKFIQRALAAGVGSTFLGGALSACGSSSSSSTTSVVAPTSATFTPSAGTAIPSTTMRIAMNPFADNSFYVIGMLKGWFREVGIDLGPSPVGVKAIPTQSVSYLVNKQADMCPMVGNNIVTNLVQVPGLRLLGFTDVFTGTYLLQSPQLHASPLSQVVASGTPFATAIKQVMAKVKGTRVGFNNSGQQRAFLDTVFKTLGGLSYSQVKLTVATDPQLVDLADGGKLDYACCNGASQVLQLLSQGWTPYVSIQDLAKGLPPGDPLVATNLVGPGPTVLSDYYERNQETCLRFMAVTWRIIDAIKSDPAGTLGVQAPYLASVTNVKTTPADVAGIYKSLDPLDGFEEQTPKYLTSTSPEYWKATYGAQISAAQKGGVLPASKTFDPSVQVIAPDVFKIMSDLKGKYEQLAAGPAPAAGQAAALAQQAKTHYSQRNYLDAYRLIKAASTA